MLYFFYIKLEYYIWLNVWVWYGDYIYLDKIINNNEFYGDGLFIEFDGIEFIYGVE